MDLGVIGVIMAGAALAAAIAAAAVSWSGRGLRKRLSREAKLDRLEDSQKSLREIKEILESQGAAAQKYFQKVGIVRFNPFADSGGDQSFSLSLLDGHGSGFVISSLHTRQETRIYLKPVLGGKAVGFVLSKEEEQAIKVAK